MNQIKFLGTGGGRFVVSRQLRKSGGIWISLDDTNIILDPGPGSLVRMLSSKPKLNPRSLDAIVVSHKHLDHSNDVNIVIEAMTNGGWDKKGVLIAPKEALEDDPVVLNYIKKYLPEIKTLSINKKYKIKNITIKAAVKNIHHNTEAYSFNIYGKNNSISIITDTKYFKDLGKRFDGDILIINVVFYKNKKNLEHLDISDVRKILSEKKPKLTILTHFGMTMIKNRPWEIAKKLTKELGLKVIAASDGMNINLDDYQNR